MLGGVRQLAAMVAGMHIMTAEEQLRGIRHKIRQDSLPSGKNRDKTKAARKQRRKRKAKVQSK